MAVLIGSGFYLSTALGAGGAAAQGTVLSAGDLRQVFRIQTDANLVGSNSTMNVGDGFVVDTNDDGDFSDEASTTQTGNDRYINSTITYTDNSTSNVTLELVSLSDGSQAILLADNGANAVNAASASIRSITLGTFNNAFENRYNQANFSNDINNRVVCFCEKTLIQTPNGERKIGTLTAGDDVVTAQDGTQKIVWAGKRKLSSAQLVASPHLKPICIRAGTLGEGIPRYDLLVSRQHRILLVSKIAERMFGQREIFVPAIKLVGVEGISQVKSVAPITYVHILFDAHQIIFANGARSESLYTGPHALHALPVESRREIFDIFPELRTGKRSTPLARPTVHKEALVRKLLSRHKKNRKQLVLSGCLQGSSKA